MRVGAMDESTCRDLRSREIARLGEPERASGDFGFESQPDGFVEVVAWIREYGVVIHLARRGTAAEPIPNFAVPRTKRSTSRAECVNKFFGFSHCRFPMAILPQLC
jgi:hypothetical protein